MNHIFTELRLFLKHPVPQLTESTETADKVKRLFTLLALDLVLVIICMFAISSAEKAGWFNESQSLWPEIMKNTPKGLLFISIVILAPVLEEVFFRSWLKPEKWYAKAVLLIIVFCIFVGAGFYIHPYAGAIAILLFFSLVIFFISKGTFISQFISEKWEQYFSYVFYFSAISFGLIHLSNFETGLNIFLLAPLLTAPQLIMGILLGFIRIKDGLGWAMLLHGIHNAIFIVPALFFMEN